MAIMNRRKLLSNHMLMIDGITFASTAIGHATGGRSAETAWAEGANVIFKGQLRHILIFGLMAFDVNPASLTSPERFTVIPESKFYNVGSPSPAGVEIINIDPDTSTEGIVLPADVSFLELVTRNYRDSWDETIGVIAEDHNVPTTKEFYYATRLAVLAYGLQYSDTPAPVYTEQDFAFFDRDTIGNYGVAVNDLLGASGPVEIAKAHVSIGNLILGA